MWMWWGCCACGEIGGPDDNSYVRTKDGTPHSGRDPIDVDGLLAELGHASGGTLSVQGVATDEVGGFSNERTLVDRSLQGRACTYLRGYLSAQLGVRLGKRTDLSAHVQYGTGFMWLHGVDVRSLMSSTLYALNLQFLVTR